MSTFSDQYNLITACPDIKTAYDTLKAAKPLITNDNELVQYYQLLINLIMKLGYKYEGYKICEKVILKSNWYVKNEFINYESHLLNALAPKADFTLKLSCPTPTPFTISSSCFYEKEKEYMCVMRAINYDYTKDGDFISRAADNIVRTKNYVVTLNDFMIKDMWELKECETLITFPYHILGMEDVRLIGPNYFFCTRLDTTSDHKPKICLGTIRDKTVIDMKVLVITDKVEKNWLPLYKHDEDCKVIYSFDPLIIYNINLATGDMNKILEVKQKVDLSTFRGSAAPIIYKDGWLCTIHQVYYSKKRTYIHRFVWLSEDFTTFKYSPAFYFEKVGVEYTLGLAHHKDGILITYTIDEKSPTLMIIPYDVIDSMLEI
jgi:hypothetical protein